MKRADRRQFIVMCGLPGSGKSTLVHIIGQLLTTRIPVTALSTDAYVAARAQEQGKTYNDVFRDEIDAATKWATAARMASFERMHHLIIDQTNLGVKKRKRLINSAPDNYLKSCIYFEINEMDRTERLLKRQDKIIPASVDTHMRDAYIRPDVNEGWDHVLTGQDVMAYCQFRAQARQAETIQDIFDRTFNVT